MTAAPAIRPLALAVVRRGDDLGTVLDGVDPVCRLPLDEVRAGRAVLYPPELIDPVVGGSAP